MPDPLATNVRRLAGLSLTGFVLLAGATFYWGFLQAEALAARPDNLRQVLADRHTRRGRILDVGGKVLAETYADGEGNLLRRYPVPAAATVVGYQTWRFGSGSQAGATYGAGGAEAAYDLALRGDLGLGLRQLVATRMLHRPQVGRDILLTVDADLQTQAASLLGDREGAVVILDVPTGAVRALVSHPTFDPSALDAKPGAATGPGRPLFNRATLGLYPPGSTWKAVTLAAALQEGLAEPTAVFADGDAVEYFDGFPVRCNNNPPGTITFDLWHAFGWSCNVTFARLGVALGETRFRRYAEAFGLTGVPPFPFPVAAGQLSNHPELRPPELASAAFGQGELLVTPLQMALVAAGVAGDGALPVPFLLADVPGLRWSVLADERGTWRRAVSPVTAAQVREAMVVAARDGWARLASEAAGMAVGGKTGTAEVPDGDPHAWFIGFAPAQSPRIAIAVLVVHGGDGSTVAAPIAGRLLASAVARAR